MTPVIAIQVIEVINTIVAGLAAAVALSLALFALRSRQRGLVQALGRVRVAPQALASAAREAERDQSDLINDVLNSAVADVAADQGLRDGLVRGALFAPSADGSLQIVEGQTVNFESPEERIRVRPGETGVGEAVRGGSPVVTIFQRPLEETTIQDPEQRRRVNPALRWIIAVPIVGADDRPVWVLSVDGLLEDRTTEELQSSVGRLLYYREVLELVLKSLARKHERRAHDHQRV